MLNTTIRLAVAALLLCRAGGGGAADESSSPEARLARSNRDPKPSASEKLPPALASAENIPQPSQPSYLDAVRAQREAVGQAFETRPGGSQLEEASPWPAEAEQEWLSHREGIRERIALQREEMDAYRRRANPRGETLKEIQKRRREQFLARRQAEYERLEQLRRQRADRAWSQPPHLSVGITLGIIGAFSLAPGAPRCLFGIHPRQIPGRFRPDRGKTAPAAPMRFARRQYPLAPIRVEAH